MYRFDINRRYNRPIVPTADCTADYKLNLCISVYHTNRRPIKNMIGVVMNRLVGMALRKPECHHRDNPHHLPDYCIGCEFYLKQSI